MEYRVLGSDDFALFLELQDKAYTEKTSETHARDFLSEKRNIFIGAFEGDMPAGFVLGYILPIWQYERKEIFLYDIEVFEEYRRRGIGRQLLQELLEEGKKRAGAEDMWLITDDSHEGAFEFYRACGASEETSGNHMFSWG